MGENFKTNLVTELTGLTKEHEESLENIIENCRHAAKNGNSHLIINTYLSIDKISKLIDLGLIVRKSINPFGKEFYIISWINY